MGFEDSEEAADKSEANFFGSGVSRWVREKMGAVSLNWRSQCRPGAYRARQAVADGRRLGRPDGLGVPLHPAGAGVGDGDGGGAGGEDGPVRGDGVGLGVGGALVEGQDVGDGGRPGTAPGAPPAQAPVTTGLYFNRTYTS